MLCVVCNIACSRLLYVLFVSVVRTKMQSYFIVLRDYKERVLFYLCLLLEVLYSNYSRLKFYAVQNLSIVPHQTRLSRNQTRIQWKQNVVGVKKFCYKEVAIFFAFSKRYK